MKKTIFAAAIVASLSLAGAASYKAWDYRSIAIEAQRNQATPAQSQLNRQVVLRDAGRPDHSEWLSSSRAIRDFVYRTNIVGSGENHGWDYSLTYAHLGDEGHEQLCGGMAGAYHWALKSVGIPARIVQLAAKTYLDGTRREDTHVTVEVYIDGEWRVSDPTFNTEFRCGDDPDFLDITEMRECVAIDHELKVVAGNTQISGRTVEEYYSPYSDLLAAYVRAPISTAQVSEPAEVVPADWPEEALAHY